MAVQSTVVVTHDKEVVADVQAKLTYYDASNPKTGLRHLANFLDRIEGGAANASVSVTVDNGDGVAASGTITLSGVGSANDTILVNGVTFTAVASGATGNQWNVGASAAASATNMAAAIAASASALVSGHVTASDNGAGVVTISSLYKGVYGNSVTIAKGTDAGTVMTVSGARLTGGAAATSSQNVIYKFGL
jgi:hypothetical protein